MKVALFASGGAIPIAALRALHPVSHVAVIIRPARAPGLVQAVRSVARRFVRGPAKPDALSKLALELGVPEYWMKGAGDPSLAPHLRGLGLDVGCVATFPWRLAPEVTGAPSRGTINTHASLLPRHRGPNPWFWTYYLDDREVGVTIHVCEERIDTGSILQQVKWPLERGYPLASLHDDVASRGAEALAGQVALIGNGTSRSLPQDASQATHARRVAPGSAMVDYAWPVERVWHFLAGLAGQFREPLTCAGQPVAYDRVTGFEVTPPRSAAGSVEAIGKGRWRLWCTDGCVELEQPAG